MFYKINLLVCSVWIGMLFSLGGVSAATLEDSGISVARDSRYNMTTSDFAGALEAGYLSIESSDVIKTFTEPINASEGVTDTWTVQPVMGVRFFQTTLNPDYVNGRSFSGVQ